MSDRAEKMANERLIALRPRSVSAPEGLEPFELLSEECHGDGDESRERKESRPSWPLAERVRRQLELES